MISYVEYLNIPAKIAITLIVLFFCMQIVGEILEFKGKVVPEFIKIRKVFARRKHERMVFNDVSSTLCSHFFTQKNYSNYGLYFYRC